MPNSTYRVYLNSNDGIQNGGNVYDVTFPSLLAPFDVSSEKNDGKWYIKVESFCLNTNSDQAASTPIAIVSNIPNANGALSTGALHGLWNNNPAAVGARNDMPLALVSSGGYYSAGSDGPGHRLSAGPHAFFSNGNINIRICYLDLTVMHNQANASWSLILGIYHLG